MVAGVERRCRDGDDVRLAADLPLEQDGETTVAQLANFTAMAEIARAESAAEEKKADTTPKGQRKLRQYRGDVIVVDAMCALIGAYQIIM